MSGPKTSPRSPSKASSPCGDFGSSAWSTCVTSLEFVIDHPESHRLIKARTSAPIKTGGLGCRYPRPGYRLAPETLREILTAPVPAELVEGTPLEGKRLCDLDEKVWDLVSPEVVKRLAEAVVSRVNVSGCNRVIQERHLPKPPRFSRLEDLRLENRTCNCLRREGFGKRLDDLSKQTVAEMLSIKAFGAKCLIDLLSSLETLASRGNTLDHKLTTEAEALGAIPESLLDPVQRSAAGLAVAGHRHRGQHRGRAGSAGAQAAGRSPRSLAAPAADG